MQLLVLSIALSQIALSQNVTSSESMNACRKKNYDRGVGKIRRECLEGESRNLGLCYTDCKPGYKPFVTRCQVECNGEFPVNCGAAFCATNKASCGSIVTLVSAGTIVGALPTILRSMPICPLKLD